MKTLPYIFLRRLFVALFCIFCFAYPIAVIGVAFDVHPPFSLDWAASVLLFLEGTLLIFASMLLYGARRALAASTLIIVLSYLVETLGVNSGFPFGSYHYTGILFPTLPGSAPLAVMFAWVLIILGTYGWIHTSLHPANFLAALRGALLATLLDFAIEPVAAHIVHYWQWLAPGAINYYGVPLANFATWFMVALALLLLTGRLLVKPLAHQKTTAYHNPFSLRLANFLPRLLFCTTLLMFGLTDLTHTYYFGSISALLAVALLIFPSHIHRNGSRVRGSSPHVEMDNRQIR